MEYSAQFGDLVSRYVQPDELVHLTITVLFNHVNPIMPLDEVMQVLVERISAQPQVVSLDAVFFFHLIACFYQRPVRGAIRDDANLGCSVLFFHGRRNEFAYSFKLTGQPVNVVLVIFRTLTVLRLLIVSAATRKVSRRVVLCARQSAIRNAIAVNVFVTSKAAKSGEIFRTQDFAAINRLVRKLERGAGP